MEIELLTERDKYSFVEKAMRGGLCVAVSKFVATRQGMEAIRKKDKDLDQKKLDKWIEEDEKLTKELGEKFILVNNIKIFENHVSFVTFIT